MGSMRFLVLVCALAGCEGYATKQIPGDGHLVIIDIESGFGGRLITDASGNARTEMEAVRRALHVWDALGAQLRAPDEVSADVAARAPHFGVHRSVVHWESAGGVCWPGLGYADIYAETIEETSFPNFEAVESTVAHELGHAMGLEHVSGDGVMRPSDEAVATTDADAAEFARVY